MITEHIREFMASKGKTLKQEAVNWSMDKLRNSIIGQINEERRGRRPGALYASDATKCPRATQYKAMGVPGEPMLPDVKLKMLMGDMAETVLVYILMHAPNVSLIENNIKGSFEIGGKPRSGATDGILVTPDGVRRHTEIKTASSVGYSITMRRGVDDNFGYLGQAEVYSRQLKKDGKITEEGTLFLYLDRDSMHIGEYWHSYTGEYAKKADENFVMIDECIETRTMVPRPYELEGRGKLPLNCSYCSHKFTCWTKPAQVVEFADDGTPIYKIEPTQKLEMKVGRNNKPIWFAV